MTVWVDAQLSPGIARCIDANFPVEAVGLRDLGLRDADDLDIFHAARDAAAIVMTKDADFIILLDRLGPPPQVIWITCGNTSNARLRDVLTATLTDALRLLGEGEQMVEIQDA